MLYVFSEPVRMEIESLPISLLMEAEPCELSIQQYPPHAEAIAVFAREEGLINQRVAGCLVWAEVQTERDVKVVEILNLSVFEHYQEQGIGSKLLENVIRVLSKQGVDEIVLSTGTFGYQLAFYQRFGFRVVEVQKDHFIEKYPQAIFEHGIRHKDALKLSLTLDLEYTQVTSRC